MDLHGQGTVMIERIRSVPKVIITAIVADVFLLMGELDVFVKHGPESKPHLAVLAHKDLLRLAQVVVVKVHTQAAMR